MKHYQITFTHPAHPGVEGVGHDPNQQAAMAHAMNDLVVKLAEAGHIENPTDLVGVDLAMNVASQEYDDGDPVADAVATEARESLGLG